MWVLPLTPSPVTSPIDEFEERIQTKRSVNHDRIRAPVLSPYSATFLLLPRTRVNSATKVAINFHSENKYSRILSGSKERA
ncbi:hypothetical protein TNCV_3780401 [Trichonephila clavipes]|nr:hypothetical protein TNCV_3780401 [Trichonephila clavipes]